jgi:hypothetical protein
MSHPRTVIGAAPRDPVLEAAAAQLAPILVVVIAAIGDHPLRPPSGPPRLAGDRSDPINQRQQLGDVVAVPAGQRHRERHTAGVDMQPVL